ncbi:hypothetical protein AGMMS4952_00690 [Spirochaetia bacterium]|nr:hypothetical protein AGMMS4952_00690 [Spirochaetia bacterium]
MKCFSIPIRGLFLLGVLVLLNSCNLFNKDDDDQEDDTGDSRTFYANNFSTNKYYILNAVKVAENERCIIYRDKAWMKKLDEEKIRSTAEEYSEKIYPAITGVFGECADIDENGKLIILLLDIVDGATVSSGSYIAGYFNPGDMSTDTSSGKGEILYMDINEGKLGSDEFNVTLAHEFQHLLRYSAFMQTGVYSEIWLDEGLSTAAEYVYLGKHLTSTYSYYNLDPYESIAGGNTFFYWEGTDLADYATAYLFFQWLRIQAATVDDPDGYNIYRTIGNAPHPGAQAVVDAAVTLIDTNLDSWDKLLRAWFTANYMNIPSKDAANGLYGYNGDIVDLTIHPYSGSGTTVSLLPGEGVYSAIKNNSFPLSGSSGSHIAYGDISNGQEPIFDPPSNNYSGEYLLTYNGNKDSTVSKPVFRPPSEIGQITGVKFPSSPAAPSRSASDTSAPRRIDGTSLLPPRP